MGRRAVTLVGSLSTSLRQALEARVAKATPEEREIILRALSLDGALRWPSDRYAKDPVRFVREVLGFEPTPKQAEIMCAVRDYPRVAVASGHKVGKSRIDASVALWFFCSFPQARAIFTSVTSRQVDKILWRELRILHRDARIPIGGELHDLARSGLVSPDFREILGFTAKEPEAVAGTSGEHLLYILDEASGIGDDIMEAIEGNRAGDARVLATSNPTRAEGFFFDFFHTLKRTSDNPGGVYCIQVSSEDSPNVRAGRVVVPGLATAAWVEEKRREWGEESALYKVRVKGEFVTKEESKCISLYTIGAAEASEAEGEGLLCIGLDPAGDGAESDEIVFAPRRGLRVFDLVAFRGLTIDAIVVHLVSLVRDLARAKERPRVVFDREGRIGSELYGALRAYLEPFGVNTPFTLVPVRASDRASKEPLVYDRQRDSLWGNLARFLRPKESGGLGGRIPEDLRLAAELHAPSWLVAPNGRTKVTPKDELKKQLKRSTDRADAVALAVWDSSPEVEPKASALVPAVVSSRITPLDPYAGKVDPFASRR